MPINYNHYHPKWTLIRRLILKRAGHCCEKCGRPNGAEIPQLGLQLPAPSLFFFMDPELAETITTQGTRKVVLTVAHIDHNRYHNEFSNLKAFCQKCHLAHDLAQRVFSFKYGKETQYQNGKLF